MVFYVKIKANITTDKLADAIAQALRVEKRSIIGIITIFDPNPPAKSAHRDVNITNFADLQYEERIYGPVKRAIADKFTSRSCVVEAGSNVSSLFEKALDDEIQAQKQREAAKDIRLIR